MIKEVTTQNLYTCQTLYLAPLFAESVYPWDILPLLQDYIKNLIQTGIDGFSEIEPGILAGQGVKIHPAAVIEPPVVLGHRCEVRPGAYIRGNVITGSDCVLGNSSEFKNSVLLNNVQAPHYNYVGDSVLGNGVHLGAGAICSNLKGDGKNVVVRGTQDYNTHLRKLGAMLGDGADIGCSCVLNPGTVVGKGTRVYPLNCLRGIFDDECIVKTPDRVVKISRQ